MQVRSKLIEIQANQAKSDEIQSGERSTVDDSLVWISLSFLVAWAIAVFLFKASKLAWVTMVFQRPKQIPCRNCRYFTNSSYLRCAVHPKQALTQTAIDCSSYESKVQEPGLRRKLKR